MLTRANRTTSLCDNQPEVTPMRADVIVKVAVVMLATATGAHADDLTILSAAAVRPALIEVPPIYVKASGHRVTVSFGNATAIQNKVTAGEPVDIVILPPAQIDPLVRQNLVGAARPFGVVRLGVAGRAGGPQPPVATPDEFKRALLAAPSFGMPDPADGSTSSTYLVRLMNELGIADAMRPKIKLFPDGTKALEAISKGEIALTVAPITSIRVVGGVSLVGPLPETLQLKTLYAAALATKAASSTAATGLMTTLFSPEIATVMSAKGIDLP
jgi:molybdate transport system substrate-binding protein